MPEPTVLDFTDVIEKWGYDPSRSRLLRHDRRALEAWTQGRPQFGAFVSYQKPTPSPYLNAEFAFQFVPGPILSDGDQSALLVGAHRILDRFRISLNRRPSLHHPYCDYEYTERDEPVDGFDLAWLTDFDNLSERVLVRWGSASSTRAWSQWAHNRKELVELRRTASEPDFPGFARFSTTLSEVAILPAAWRGALGSVGGVYLLVCPRDGTQYVGSAYGEGGFWGRWLCYAADGHGGNVLLRARERSNFVVSILEIASPDMSLSDVIARETHWKIKLGSRAHGLNAN